MWKRHRACELFGCGGGGKDDVVGRSRGGVAEQDSAVKNKNEPDFF